MLVMFLPEQAAEHWSDVKYYIEQAVPRAPGAAEDWTTNVLECLLDGRMKLWVSYNENKEFDGIVVTRVYNDDIDRCRTMLVYCIYSLETGGESSWISAWETLAIYARSQGCGRVIGYTKDDGIKETVKLLGGKAEYTLCTIPL